MNVEILGHVIELRTARLAETQQVVCEQLAEYERGTRRRFELTFDWQDGFTDEVHREIRAIPYGETRTYSQLAERLDTAPIAVGGACARNTLPVVVPCHRVVGTDAVRGYRYPGLKTKLLALERTHHE
jgi:methylated-DNA-[protein]-cysteine S-methyltransferase